jgi:hypothetical protein
MAAIARPGRSTPRVRLTVTTPAANADTDHDLDLDTIDDLVNTIRKGLLMIAIQAFAAKYAAGSGHVCGRQSGAVHAPDPP